MNSLVLNPHGVRKEPHGAVFAFVRANVFVFHLVQPQAAAGFESARANLAFVRAHVRVGYHVTRQLQYITAVITDYK